LRHWVSKGAADWAGFGPKIIEQLAEQGLIKDIADFYDLTADQLKILPGLGDKSANNLILVINQQKTFSLNKFIYGLGIRQVGQESASVIADFLINRLGQGQISKTFQPNQIVRAANSLSLEEWQALPDIGPKVAQFLVEWFLEPTNLKLIDRLSRQGVRLLWQNQAKTKQSLAGKTFVLTGSLIGLTRSQAEATIKQAGGKISSQVSRQTDYLVAGSSPGSKLAKAKQFGVKIIDEANLLTLLN
jgi:DNA ligase (NAD+)